MVTKRWPWVRPIALVFGVLILCGVLAEGWYGGKHRVDVCRMGIADIMDLTTGTGHIDTDSQSVLSGYPNVDLLIVSSDGAAVHDAECGFSIGYLFLMNPVLESVTIDDIAISAVRVKLLGIALGIETDPAPTH